MKLGFHVNLSKPNAAATRDALTAHAKRSGITVVPCSEAEAIAVLGGDGTVLAAVHAYPSVPVLGLNLGSLGYLSGVEAPHFIKAIDALARGEFTITERSMLAVTAQGLTETRALNDIVISRGVSGHAATLELTFGANSTTRFIADGLVIATPTGSTAYSLSAGGPVLLPDTASFTITPVCPHALAARPLVVRDTTALTLRALPRNGIEDSALAVFADGRNCLSLSPGQALQIYKSATAARFITLNGYDPCSVLVRKFGWGK